MVTTAVLGYCTWEARTSAAPNSGSGACSRAVTTRRCLTHEGSEELFLVLSGRLRIETEGQSHFVDSGRSARLASDRPYSYHSDGDEAVVFVRVVRVTQPEG